MPGSFGECPLPAASLWREGIVGDLVRGFFCDRLGNDRAHLVRCSCLGPATNAAAIDQTLQFVDRFLQAFGLGIQLAGELKERGSSDFPDANALHSCPHAGIPVSRNYWRV